MAALVLTAGGLGLVILYFAHVGKLGEPTDIGGIFVLLAGWLMVGAGVSLFVLRLTARRDARRARPGDTGGRPSGM
jgi:hypothetical protein